MGGRVSLAFAAVVTDFDVEFMELDGRIRRGPLRSLWCVPFERVPPVRSFPSYKGQRNFPGWYYASTMDAHVGFESWLERDHAIGLDHDVDVVGFSSQPFWLCWGSESGRRRHAPDFFARTADGSGVVIDVRADEQIAPADEESFSVMGMACQAVGWEFRRVGAVDALLARNLRWLSRYRHRRFRGVAPIPELLVEAFACPGPLLAGAAVAGDTLATLPVLFHLMWRQVLIADLTQAALGPATPVHAAGSGGCGGGR